ncbi:ABC transporter permease [Lysobacter sp. cf310]|uniref:ABC transporter permease n=1 Tax=Lysobacter sp. cf310 TaxID=1761790 RepID=UPI0008E2B18E|nr:FtsX-like permease family protein [Lysobacter sp. cf310]SFK95006.1 putative ABC transport system permease protein [Lysobacter sp. cf310]
MNDMNLIWRYHRFFRLRSLLLTGAVALAFCTFGILGALRYSMNGGDQSIASRRLMVTSAAGAMQVLPLSSMDAISKVEGLRTVSYATWIGLYYREQSNMFMSFAVDPKTWIDTHPDMAMDESTKQAFLKDRRAILVSTDIADKFGWKKGDSVPLHSLLFKPPQGESAWNYIVAGVFRSEKGAGSRNYAVTHYDYLNENRNFWKDTVGSFVVTLDAKVTADDASQRIDAALETSAWPSYTSSDQVFHNEFFAQFGDVVSMIELVVAVTFGTLMLIVSSGMALGIRQRRRDLGILRVIGYSNAKILRIVVGQTMMVVLVGAALGMLIAFVFNWAITSRYPEILPHMSLPIPVMMQALAIGVLLSLAAAAIPAFIALRTKPVEAMAEEAI